VGGAWTARAFAALALPRFRRFLLGHVASVHAFWMRVAAQGWLVYELTGSTAALGGVTAAGLVPSVVLAPWAGALADRHDKRRLLLVCTLGTLTGNGAMAALLFTGGVSVGLVTLAALWVGCFRAVEMPVRQAYVVDVVGRDVLGNAIALQASTFNVGRIVGPALAGVLIAALGIGGCYAAAGALSLGTLFTLLGLPSSPVHAHAGARGALAQLVEGLSYVRGHALIRRMMLLMGGSMLCAWVYTGMLAALARESYGLDERGYGLLMGLSGVGALAGALWVSGRALRHAADAGLLARLVGLGGLSVAALALAPSAAWGAAPLLAAAFCQVAFMSSSNTRIQAEVEDHLRGRVMGLWVFTFGATLPLGSLLVGHLAQVVGLRHALLVCGGLAVALALAFVPRRERAPTPAPLRLGDVEDIG
jgi:MFS family permease